MTQKYKWVLLRNIEEINEEWGEIAVQQQKII